MATSKQGPKVGAKTGKVKGTGAVTPSAPETSSENVEQSVQTDNGASKDEFPEVYQAGWDASVKGAPTRPSLEYSDDEVRAWYRGYKAHANPNAEQPVAAIQKGYRGDY